MSALHTPPQPTLHGRIREDLRERIVRGVLQPNDRVPSESELMAQYGVSRITVRQALDDLRNEGLIVKVAGKGTFVAGARPSQELARLEGFGEAMARGGHRIVNRVVSHVLVPAASQVAERLRLDAGAQVSEIRRVRYLDSAPVSFEVTYLPPRVGERLRGEDLAGRDIFLILESDYGITLGHADVQIGAISADAGLATALSVAPGTALLRIERLTWTADGMPLDFEYLYVRGDAFQYTLRLPRHAGSRATSTGA